MKLLFPNDPIERERLSAGLSERGFVLSSDGPVTNNRRSSAWDRGDDVVGYTVRRDFGTWVLYVVGPGEEALAAELAAWLPSRSGSEVLADELSDRPLTRIRQVFEILTAASILGDASPEAHSRSLALLEHDDELVRWAALRTLPLTREGLAVVARSAERHPEMQHAYDRLLPFVERAEEGTLNDHDTRDRWELLRRAREGAEAGQWRRVAKAMDVLLEDSPWDDEALHLRALAHEGMGELFDALALLGAAEKKVDAFGDAEASDDELDEDDEQLDEDDDLDEDEHDDEHEDADERSVDPEKHARLLAIRAKLEELRPRAAELGAEDRATVRERLVERMHAWQAGYEAESLHGAARALRGVFPELEGVLAFFAGSYDRNEAVLEEALTLHPDSPSVARELAYAVLKRDEAEGLRRLEALRDRLRDPAPLSEGSALLERLVAAGGERNVPTEASILETLAKSAYDAKDYARAAALGDELVALDPDTGLGWQLRANARIFALRHEEAVVAYREAIEALERIYAKSEAEGSIMFGGDPRPGMWFNLSCALAKLERRDEAIAALRTAVRGDEKYAAEAKSDDYMEFLFGDEEFEAICALDPVALRSAQERDPAWVKALVARARDEQQGGDVRRALTTAIRAAELAEALGDASLSCEALAVLGRMQVFTGDLDAGLASSERALGLAAKESVPPEVRAVAYAQRGICLQAAGRLDEAEAAYESAFEARRAAFGEKHPSLVKSLVSIVGVALARERPAAEVEGLITRGVDIAQDYLASEAPKDHLWAETIDDLVSLLFRRSLLRADDASADAVAPLALALDQLEEQRAVGYVPMAAVVEQLAQHAASLANDASSQSVAQAAQAVARRAEGLLVGGPPEERPTRLYFRRLRAWIEELRRSGVEDARIASVLADAVRGSLEEGLRDVPLLVELRNLLAVAAARESTVLVTSVMALSMAELPGQLDESLRQLEELVAPIVAESAG